VEAGAGVEFLEVLLVHFFRVQVFVAHMHAAGGFDEGLASHARSVGTWEHVPGLGEGLAVFCSGDWVGRDLPLLVRKGASSPTASGGGWLKRANLRLEACISTSDRMVWRSSFIVNFINVY
jgi:hypothetical protein